MRWLKLLLLALVLLMLAGFALDDRPLLRRYEVETPLIDHPVQLAVLTDMHGCDCEDNGAALVASVAEAGPDLILLAGDMFSADGNPDEELVLFRNLASLAPVYYVTGNHEYWEFDVSELTMQIIQAGVTVLDRSSRTITVKGQEINICGIPDPYAMVYCDAPDTRIQLEQAATAIMPGAYTILLAHRPELMEAYAAAGCFDLVLSGHAHGGQIRIPGLINGLYAPNQGLFPKYAGGRYEHDGTTMLVSRGLSNQKQMGIPRIFNRPEWLLVTLK